ncbi:MAG: HPr kinase/phosphatase C-terminal domain-containing protein [Acetobacteraceae bacterium]
MHGSCVSRNGEAVLLVGPAGAGKSDLVLRLLARGFELVADDQVEIDNGMVSCPDRLAGLLEVRGLGIVRLPYRTPAHLALVAELGTASDRLPEPAVHPDLGLPVVHIDPAAASAPERVALALDCVLGSVPQVAGFCVP